MRNRYWANFTLRVILPLAVLSLCVVFGASARADNRNSHKTSENNGTVVAVVGPRRGVHLNRFDAIFRGVRSALSSHVLRSKVRVIAFDDGCNAGAAKTVAQEIVEAGSVVVIGHPCGSAARAALEIYRGAGILFISVGGRGPGEFQIVRTADAATNRVSRHLADIALGQPIVLVHDKTRYGRDLSQGIAQGLRDKWGVSSEIITIDAAKTSYTAVAHRIVSSGAAVVHFAGFPTEARILVEDLEAASLNSAGNSPNRNGLLFVGSETLVTSEFIWFVERRANPSLSGSIRVGLSVPYTSASMALFSRAKRAGAVERRLQDNSAEVDAHSAMQIWLDAFSRSKSKHVTMVAREMRIGRFKTVIGEASFDGHGVLSLPSSHLAVFDGFAWMPLKLAVSPTKRD